MAIAEFEPGPNEAAILPTEPPSDIRLKALPRVGTKRACAHCLGPIAKNWPSVYCRLCIDEEGPIPDPLREALGVRACRDAGIRAIARPCSNPDCKGCLTLLGRVIPMALRRESSRQRGPNFTDRDADDLRRYFSKSRKTSIGGGSALGALASRTGEGTNPNSKERPLRTEPRCPVCAVLAMAAAKRAQTSHDDMVDASVIGMEALKALPHEKIGAVVRAVHSDGVLYGATTSRTQDLIDALMNEPPTVAVAARVAQATRSESWRAEAQRRLDAIGGRLSEEDRSRLENDPAAYAEYFKAAVEEATAGLPSDDIDPNETVDLVADPDAVHFKTETDAHLLARSHLHGVHAAALTEHFKELLGDLADEVLDPIPLVIVGDETLSDETPEARLQRFADAAPMRVIRREKRLNPVSLRRFQEEYGLGAHLLESIVVSAITTSHHHSKADLEAFKPIRFYDKEVNGKLVQVQVFPSSIEPLTYESHRIRAKASGGSGKCGSWDDEAVDFVEGRLSESAVNRILAKLPETHRDRLESYYSQTEELAVRSGRDPHLGAYVEVALLTEAAQKAHDALAENGEVVTLRDTLETLRKRASGTGTNREPAVRRLESMRKQAEKLVAESQVAYALAASTT